MYELLFSDRLTISKHRNGPLAAEREAYLRKRMGEGFSLQTLIIHARKLLLIAEKLKKLTSGVTSSEIAQAAKRLATKRKDRAKVRQSFIFLATKWSNEMGVLKGDDSPISLMVQEYESFLGAVRGLSAKTIVNHRWYVTDFLKWHSQQGDDGKFMTNISAENVDKFFIDRCSAGWSRASAACAARVLRTFFRYAYKNGFCSFPVADSIQSPRIYGLESLPAGPSWKDVARLLEQLDLSNRTDIRDRAIIMLCAVYGFRSSEVCQLRLEDLDWDNSRIRVWRSKQRRRQEYPLATTVGEAIIQYLRQVRPTSDRREVFLLLSPPFSNLSAPVVYEIVRSRYDKLGIVSRKRGPHSLRHACAARLIDQGLTLKEVGDQLGHRYASVTSAYVKVDLRSLREVAVLVEGGAL